MRSRWDKICNGRGDGARSIFGTPESEAQKVCGYLSGCSSRKGLLKNQFNIGTFQRKALCPSHDDNIAAFGQDRSLLLRRRADDPTDAVSLGRIAKFLADGQPQAGLPQPIFSPIDHQRFINRTFSLMIRSFEIHVFFNAFDSHSISSLSIKKATNCFVALYY